MSTSALRGDVRLPLYQRLADTLRQEIVEGRRRSGDRLPSENVIAKEYDLAPGTARQAFAKLVTEGLLERFHGKGTYVRRPQFDQSFFRFFRFTGAGDSGAIPESRILRRSVDTVPAHVAHRLQVTEGEDAVRLSRLRLFDGVPVMAEDIWLPMHPFAPLVDVAEDEIGPLLYPVYDARFGKVVVRAQEDLTVGAASKEAAQLLEISAGEPVIVVDRLARGYDGNPIEWRRYTGLASQFHYQTEIR